MKRVLIVLALFLLVAGIGLVTAQSGGTKAKVYEVTDDGVTQPRLMEAATPGYPDEGKKKKVSGDVVLSVVVDTSGNVTDIKVKKSLEKAFDDSAIEAAKIFKYKPATKDDEPVNVRMDLTFNFFPPS